MLSVVVKAVRGSLERRSMARHRASLERLGDAVAEVRRSESAAAVAPESSRPADTDTSDPTAARRSWPSGHRVVATAVAVAVLLGLSLALLQGTNRNDEPLASSPPATSSTTATTTTTTAPSTTTTTTVVSPVSADERGAVFAAGQSVTVLVVAHGRSWVGVRNADGTSGFEGTLEPGDSQQIEGVSPLQIRLGSPTDVEILLDGVPAQFPAQPGQPLDLTFEST